MPHPLHPHIAVADAVARLFHPHVEVVIHDVAAGTIFHIANPVSGRRPGDNSRLDLDDGALDGRAAVIGPYENANKTGQRVRSITAVLNDDGGRSIGLMCINLDLSVYEPALDLLESLIRPPKTQQPPELLFQNDWRAQIKLEIGAFLDTHGIALEKLTPDIRKTMMAALDEKGLFFAKRSIEQIAGILGISRATAYNDLKAARKMNPQKQPFTHGRPT